MEDQNVYKINTKREKKESNFEGPLEIIKLLENKKVKFRIISNKTKIIHVK